MNTKTYNFVKYIATLGALFLFLAPLLGFLDLWKKGEVFNHNAAALAATVWVLELVGIILIVGYVYLRTKLKVKSGYEYNKKEEIKLNISFAMYGAEIVLSFIYVIISCGIFKADARTGLMIAFAPIYVFQFAAAILAAIFESWSRIGEQAYLYQQQEKIKESGDIKVSKTGTKRTKEAQALLADDEKPAKQQQHKAEVHLDDEQTLEDFFNEDVDDKKNK